MFIIAYVARTSTLPVIFTAHREELLDQCASELAYQGITNVSILRADDPRYNQNCSIQITSIHTAIRRELPFTLDSEIIIIVDEAHRSVSDSYQQLIRRYPKAIVLGFTATPWRLDSKPFGSTYDDLISIVTHQELLKNPEWLVEPTIYGTPLKPDLTNVPTEMGDFAENELAQAMSLDHLVGDAVQHWVRLADGRRTFCFAVNIAHSELLASKFEAAGAKVAHLDGKTPTEQRRAILADIRSGKLQIVSNCNLLLEGIDIPPVKCVVHCRPTQSLTLWMQSTMRIGRPWQGVKPLLLDHAGNYDHHGSPCDDRKWSLTHGPVRNAGKPPMKLCRRCFAYVAAHLLFCPHCHFEFPKEERKLPTASDTELVVRNSQGDDEKRAFFQKMAFLARAKGYKPGFAAAKYKEHYGQWPPNAWSDGLKSIFAQDERWQRVVTMREEEKRKKAAEEAEEQRKWETAAAEGFDIGRDAVVPAAASSLDAGRVENYTIAAGGTNAGQLEGVATAAGSLDARLVDAMPIAASSQDAGQMLAEPRAASGPDAGQGHYENTELADEIASDTKRDSTTEFQEWLEQWGIR